MVRALVSSLSSIGHTYNPSDDFEQGHDAGTFVQTDGSSRQDTAVTPPSPQLSSHMRGFPLLSDNLLSFKLDEYVSCNL